MILSASVASTAKTCWYKAFNVYHRGIQSTNYNLVDGGAMHAGIAHGLATKNWDQALETTRQEFTKRAAEIDNLEYSLLTEHHLQLCLEMVKCYRDAFEEQDVTVIQPEAIFKIPIGLPHNNIFKHWLNPEGHQWAETSLDNVINHIPQGMRGPNAEEILAGVVRNPHPKPDDTCPCWEPHFLVGTTDAIVRWGAGLWLMEHKSTAIGGEQFFAPFRVDLQPTVYLLAIKKALGLRLSGFILNAIRKPSEAQVAGWNNRRKDKSVVKTQKDYLEFSREPFTRTDRQLEDQEKDLVLLGNEWESRVLSGYFPLSNVRSICMQYNKPCTFMNVCAGDEGETLIQLMKDSMEKKLVEVEE